MKWIKLKDRKPSCEIDGDKILIYRILNESQDSMSVSIFNTKMIKHSNEDETWWMSLPDEPIINKK
jgi:hypothetical protein